MLEDLTVLRNLMKKKFPTHKDGTVVADVHEAVQKFTGGVRYTAEKVGMDLDYARITAPVGFLEMTPEQMSDNVSTLLASINSHRNPARGEYDFITEVKLTSPPSEEAIYLDMTPFKHLLKTFPKQTSRRGKQEAAEEE